MAVDEAYRREIETAVMTAIADGYTSFSDICRHTHGADPRLVDEIYRAYLETPPPPPANDVATRTTYRSRAIPAADPFLSQWWFRDATTARLSRMISEVAPCLKDGEPPARIAFLGTPTVGLQYAFRYGPAVILDADPDFARTLTLPKGSIFVPYHTGSPLPADLVGRCPAVLMDPPWYPDVIQAFLARGLALLAPGGHLFCTLPPRLVRPAVMEERKDLLQWLHTTKVAIVSLTPHLVDYDVPAFEAAALSDLERFNQMPWRIGDLLHARRADSLPDPFESAKQPEIERFSRRAATFRVFLRADASDQKLARYFKRNDDFRRAVSRRAYDFDRIHIWTSNNVGGVLKDVESTRLALRLWAGGSDRPTTAGVLEVERGLSSDQASGLVKELARDLGLWTHEPATSLRRTDQQQREVREKTLSPWATLVARDRPNTTHVDTFRLEFPRDRDRVLWSHGLRRLANKTQVFPATHDDNVRQRLAHSVEVKQLAATIGDSFGLDPDLIEAGALAHDIGHTPFGHAGEYAIDRLFNLLSEDLGGFNHYEHGVDVVRWLEDAYMAPVAGGFPGLNLTPEVAECIFKHTYCQSGHQLSQAELWKRSKHQDYFDSRMCHLEGQAVRLADKVSYLVSDLEDGIRLGVFTTSQLLACRLFNRPGIDIVSGPAESLFQRFLAQRRNLLAFIMEDAIEAMDLRLSEIGDPAKIAEQKAYVVNHSSTVAVDVDEVWTRLQAGLLHRDPRVIMGNMRAARIIQELVLLFALAPALVEPKFSMHHEQLHRTKYLEFYRSRIRKVTINRDLLAFIPVDGIIGMGHEPGKSVLVPVEQLIMAKDYVAGLTDGMAAALHSKHLSFA